MDDAKGQLTAGLTGGEFGAPPKRRSMPDEELDTQDGRRFHALMIEYERSIANADRQFDHILRVAGIAFSAAGALLFLVAERNLPLGEWASWMGPLLLLILYAFVIYLTYMMVFTGYYTRDLEDDIARLTGISYFHFTNTMARSLTSLRTGHPPTLAACALLIMFAAGIYLAFLFLGFRQLRVEGAPLWRQATYVVVQLIFMTALLWSALGIFGSLRERYDYWKVFSGADTRRGMVRRANLGPPFAKLIGYALVPRLFELVFKSIFTIGALVITALILGIPFDGRMLTIGLLTLFCVEFLAKQATYIWNEILDVEMDKGHSHKNRRILGQMESTHAGKLLFLTRSLAAAATAIMLHVVLDLWWLPPLVAVIFVWQFMYDRWAKRGPRRRLWVASIGYAERAAAGSLAAMSAGRDYDPLLVILLSGWFVVCMVMTLAEYWWAERRQQWNVVQGHAAERHVDPPPKSGIWFTDHGPGVEKAANGALIVIGLLMAFLYTRDSSDRPGRFSSFVESGVRWGEKKTSTVVSHLGDGSASVASARSIDDSLPDVQFGAAMIVLSIIGVSLMLVIRGKVQASNRFAWLAGILAATAMLVVTLPSQLWLVAVSLGLPLLLAANYHRLSFAEIVWWENILSQVPKYLPSIVDHVLFRPWAVRISVRPVDAAFGPGEFEWAETIVRMYRAWASVKRSPSDPESPPRFAECPRDTVEHRVSNHVIGHHDLILQAPALRWWSLGKDWRRLAIAWRCLVLEGGLHRLTVASATPGAPLAIYTVRVIVQPIGVAPSPAMGTVIDVPLLEGVSDPPVTAASEVARCYSADHPSTPARPLCHNVLDPRTGIASDHPSKVLSGCIAEFLTFEARQRLSTWRRERRETIGKRPDERDEPRQLEFSRGWPGTP